MTISNISNSIGPTIETVKDTMIMDSMKASANRFGEFMSEKLNSVSLQETKPGINKIEDMLIGMTEDMKVGNIEKRSKRVTPENLVAEAVEEMSKKMRSIPSEVIDELNTCAKDLCFPTSVSTIF